MVFKVNKKNCIGCGACVAVCPKAVKLAKDGKAEIINSKELGKCGGRDICPMEAIEKVSDKKNK